MKKLICIIALFVLTGTAYGGEFGSEVFVLSPTVKTSGQSVYCIDMGRYKGIDGYFSVSLGVVTPYYTTYTTPTGVSVSLGYASSGIKLDTDGTNSTAYTDLTYTAICADTYVDRSGGSCWAITPESARFLYIYAENYGGSTIYNFPIILNIW